MASKLFLRLIEKIVTEDGAGHRELEEKISSGEVSKEEGVLIVLRANALILKNKVEALAQKVDTVLV